MADRDSLVANALSCFESVRIPMDYEPRESTTDQLWGAEAPTGSVNPRLELKKIVGAIIDPYCAAPARALRIVSSFPILRPIVGHGLSVSARQEIEGKTARAIKAGPLHVIASVFRTCARRHGLILSVIGGSSHGWPRRLFRLLALFTMGELGSLMRVAIIKH